MHGWNTILTYEEGKINCIWKWAQKNECISSMLCWILVFGYQMTSSSPGTSRSHKAQVSTLSLVAMFADPASGKRTDRSQPRALGRFVHLGWRGGEGVNGAWVSI